MANEKLAFSADDAHVLATNLGTSVTALIAKLANAGNQGKVDDASDHTWYGIPEAIGDDLNQAIDLIALINLKLDTVLL